MKKDDAVIDIAQYDGVWSIESPIRRVFRDDLGLVLKSKVAHAAISSKLEKPFVFTDKPLVVQYEVQLQVIDENSINNKTKLQILFINRMVKNVVVLILSCYQLGLMT